MQNLLRNLRFSVRMLRKNPGLTLTVLLTLALGVGANTAIFTVDYATLLQPLPYPHPEQLVVVWSKIQGHHNGISAGDYTDWKRENTSFQDLNAWTGRSFNMATQDQPDKVDGRLVTPGYYKMLGQPFFLGRDFLPEEGQIGRDHEVILTHRLWKRLGGNLHIIGQPLRLDGQPYTVVGVLQPGVFDRGQGDMAVPLSFTPEQLNHDFHWLLVMGRMKPGVSLTQARADMDAQMRTLCGAAVPGDTYRNLVVDASYSAQTFKHILAPVWLLTYTFGAKSFQCVINGVSGAVDGEYPKSPWKIALLVVAAIIVVIIVLSANGHH